MKRILNVIFGINGQSLSDSEKSFFREINPLGFIIFARNIQDPQQLKRLVSELKECVNHEHAQILIDQEGGIVRRLKPPHFRDCKPASIFAEIALRNLEKAKEAVFINHYLMGKELHSLGINVNCAPVADLLRKKAHKIIGNRSYGNKVSIVVDLCKAANLGLLSASVQPIMKHIPGHGRANADSHFKLPIVKTPLGLLEKTDFAVFKDLGDISWAMTAHVVYSAIDAAAPATLSKKVISYIRNNINFKGILVSDDLVMKALSGNLKIIAEKAQQAGCDILLHCNGDLKQMQEIATAAKTLEQSLVSKIQHQLPSKLNSIALPNIFHKHLDSSIIELEKKLDDLIA